VEGSEIQPSITFIHTSSITMSVDQINPGQAVYAQDEVSVRYVPPLTGQNGRPFIIVRYVASRRDALMTASKAKRSGRMVSRRSE
jgi:hypothetical protein